MRQLLVGLIVGTCVVSLQTPSFAATRTITGQLVDAACYKMDKSNIAVDHKMPQGDERNCAVECARTGLPVALLAADGKLYIVTGTLAVNENAALLRHMSQEVTLIGDVTEGVGTMIIAATQLMPVRK
jgi:hypothetical protein